MKPALRHAQSITAPVTGATAGAGWERQLLYGVFWAHDIRHDGAVAAGGADEAEHLRLCRAGHLACFAPATTCQ